MKRRFRPLLLVAMIIALLVLGYLTVERAALKNVKRTDFTVYLAAAHAVLDGGEHLYEVTNERGWHYTMPPLFAVLMVPFALLPPALASSLWYVITIALLFASLTLIARLVGHPGEEHPWKILIVPLLLCIDPLLDTITRGQLGILMLAACVAALWLSHQRRSLLAGLLVALATTLKVYSGLLVLYLLHRRDRRALLGCAGGFLLFGLLVPAAALGPRLAIQLWSTWFTRVVMPYSGPPGGVLPFDELQDPAIAKNQSLYGTFFHVGAWFGAQTSSQIGIKVAVALATLVLLALMVMAWQPAARPLERRRLGLEWSLPLMLGLLVVPTSWSHYFVLLLFPLTAACALLRHQATPGEPGVFAPLRRSLLLFGACSVLYTATSLIRPLAESPSLWHDLVMIPRSAGLLCWGTLILGAAFWRLLRKNAVDGREAT